MLPNLEKITLIHKPLKVKGQIPKTQRENGKKIRINNSHIQKDQNDSQTWKNVHAYSLLEKWKLKWPFFSYCCCLLSCVWLSATPWTIAHQALLSMRLSRQEYWSGLPFPIPGDHPNPGMGPTSLETPHWQADSLALAAPGKPLL